MNALSFIKVKRNPTDLIIHLSKELYGYTPEEKSDENREWMLQNGYLKKRHRRDIQRKRSKTERTLAGAAKDSEGK